MFTRIGPLPPGVFGRRDFLRFTTGAVTLAIGGVAASRGRAAGCMPGGQLNLFTYQGYDGAGLPAWDAFWADNDIVVNLRPLGSEDTLQVLKSPGGDEWDAFMINQGDVGRYESQRAFSPVSVEEVPNLANMYPNLAESPIWKVSDGVYRCVPLTIGPLGIHWNVSTHPDGFTSYAAALEKDLRVSAFDNALNMISTAACAVGLDPATLSRQDLGGPVRDWLMQARPQIKVISGSLGDQLTVLLNKEVDLQLVGFPWNVLQARTQGVDIGFAIPTEGSYGYVDSIGVSATAPNRCAAIAYCNAGITPETAAPLNDSLVGLGATPEINAALSSEARALFPDDIQTGFFDVLKWNVQHFDPEGPYATNEEWEAVWNEVKLTS